MRTLPEINQDIEKYQKPATPSFAGNGRTNTALLMMWGENLDKWEKQIAPFIEEKRQLFKSLDEKYKKTFWGKLGFKRPEMWGLR